MVCLGEELAAGIAKELQLEEEQLAVDKLTCLDKDFDEWSRVHDAVLADISDAGGRASTRPGICHCNSHINSRRCLCQTQ